MKRALEILSLTLSFALVLSLAGGGAWMVVSAADNVATLSTFEFFNRLFTGVMLIICGFLAASMMELLPVIEQEEPEPEALGEEANVHIDDWA